MKTRSLLPLALALASAAPVCAATTDERCNDLLQQALENKNPDTRKQAVAAEPARAGK